MRNTLICWVVTLCLAVSLLGVPAAAEEGPEHEAMMSGGMMEACQEMMAKRQDMHEEMAARDARLEELVAEMNAASGKKKVDAIGAVVNELVAQRQAMHQKMASMQPQMMPHMMQHMRAGMMHGMMESMCECPMMKQMMMQSGEEGAEEGGEGAHSEHHPEE